MTTIKLSEEIELQVEENGEALFVKNRGKHDLTWMSLTRDETYALYEALHARYTSVSVPYDPITPQERKRMEKP